jgi:cell division protein FtsL
MGRVCVLVAMVLMFSALSLVTARYQARQLYDQLDRYKDNSRLLEIEWRRLQLDRAAESSNSKVDRLAREDLKMTVIVPDRTVFVSQPGQAVSQSAQPSSAKSVEQTGGRGGPR